MSTTLRDYYDYGMEQLRTRGNSRVLDDDLSYLDRVDIAIYLGYLHYRQLTDEDERVNLIINDAIRDNNVDSLTELSDKGESIRTRLEILEQRLTSMPIRPRVIISEEEAIRRLRPQQVQPDQPPQTETVRRQLAELERRRQSGDSIYDELIQSGYIRPIQLSNIRARLSDIWADEPNLEENILSFIHHSTLERYVGLGYTYVGNRHIHNMNEVTTVENVAYILTYIGFLYDQGSPMLRRITSLIRDAVSNSNTNLLQRIVNLSRELSTAVTNNVNNATRRRLANPDVSLLMNKPRVVLSLVRLGRH